MCNGLAALTLAVVLGLSGPLPARSAPAPDLSSPVSAPDIVAQAPGACRQALALALDVSGSVDADEYALQRDGLAAALEDARVAQALLSMTDAPVALLIFEWSGAEFQRILVPWTRVTDTTSLALVISQLRGVRRVPAPSSTALGTAIDVGRALLAEQPGCWRHTLDVSGDGPSNDGPRPRDLSSAGTTGAALPDITINALVIGPARGAGDAADDGVDTRPQNGRANGPSRGTGRPAQNLLSYFRAEVIAGPGAFAEPVEGYANYRTAMIRKLLREIRTLAIGAPSDPPSIQQLR